MTKEQYILSFMAHVQVLNGKWMLLKEELAQARGVEKFYIQRQLNRIQHKISKAGSVYSGLCSGRIKPWEDAKEVW